MKLIRGHVLRLTLNTTSSPIQTFDFTPLPSNDSHNTRMKLSGLVALSGLFLATEAASLGHRSPKKPNVLFIMTDDQDLEMNSPDFTPSVLKHIRDKGIEFTNHFVTTSLCCPSRVSLWTGMQAHNTNVRPLRTFHRSMLISTGHGCFATMGCVQFFSLNTIRKC